MMVDRVRKVLASTFQLPDDAVHDGMAYSDSKEWDSLNHINLMLALEEAFGISIADDDIVELTNVGAIERYLAQRGVLEPPTVA